MSVKVSIINKSRNPLPDYETEGSAGMDLRADLSEAQVLPAGEQAMIPTGIHIELPLGYEAQVRARSGLAARNGIGLVNAPGTIDSDYRGEIKVILINWSKKDFVIEPGSRIARMVVARHERVEWKEAGALTESERGAGGFGSTGTA